jgi:hypothetical protein
VFFVAKAGQADRAKNGCPSQVSSDLKMLVFFFCFKTDVYILRNALNKSLQSDHYFNISSISFLPRQQIAKIVTRPYELYEKSFQVSSAASARAEGRAKSV